MRRALLGSLAAVAGALAGAAGAFAAVPAPQARAVILVQPDTGTVIYARNADARLPVASATKLMTALVALEHLRLGDEVTAVPYRATEGESLAGFAAGERLTVADTLRALLLPSANDAAATLAVAVAGSRRAFVRMMNERARQLGLRNTRYANPIGLDDPDNYSSAADLAKLAIRLRRNEFFRRTVDTPVVVLHSGLRPRTLINRNTLLDEDGVVDGVKTGHTTRAGYVLVGSATRAGVNVVSAVIGDSSEATRDADSLALLRYGLSRFRRVVAARAGRAVATARVDLQRRSIPLVASRTVAFVAPRDRRVRTRLVGVPRTVSGPLPARARQGTIEVRVGGRVVARVPVVNAGAVRGPTVLERARDLVGRPLTILVLALLAIGSLQLIRVRRRGRRGPSERLNAS